MATIYDHTRGPPLSHVFFADDLVIFAEVFINQLQKTLTCLRKFCDISGQKIFFDKSKLFLSPKIKSSQGRELERLCGMPRTTDLGKYLGVPILHTRVKGESYAGIVEKMRKRLAGWKAQHLSIAGRSILLQSVLSSIPT